MPSVWTATIHRYVENEPKAVAKAVEDLAEEAAERIRDRTPVDTGAARDGWEMNPSGEGFKRKVRIINRLRYINLLEHGSSRQAPHGMVALTVAELKSGV